MNVFGFRSPFLPKANSVNEDEEEIDEDSGSDSESESEEDPDLVAAKGIKSLRKSKGTKSNYGGKMRKIKAYFLEKQNEDAKGFQNIVDASGELVLPLPFKCVEALFGRLSRDPSFARVSKKHQNVTSSTAAFVQRLEDGDASGYGRKTMSVSCMQGYKSALKHYYEQRGFDFKADDIDVANTSLDKHLESIIDGYTKNIANKKVTGVMDVVEGKSAISRQGYYALNEKFVKFKPTQKSRLGGYIGLMCWVSSVLMMNCICRSETLDTLHLEHFAWENDSLKVSCMKTKKDQGGVSQYKDKYLFSAPHNPLGCPILAIGKRIIT